MDLNQLKTDPNKTDQGTWVRIDDSTRLKLARFGSPAFQRAFKERMGPMKKLKGKAMGEKEADEITVDIMLDAVLLDWEGITQNGEEVPFSRAREILLDPQYRDFRIWIAELADDIENFRVEQVEEDSEN